MSTPHLPPEESPPGALEAALAQVEALQQTVQALQARESHMNGLLNLARDAVIAMDRNGLVTDWNPAAESMLGYPRAEALGARLSDLIIPTVHRAAHEAGFARYLASRQPTIMNRLIEIEALHRSGALIAVELAIWSFPSGDSLGFGAFIRDISDRRAAEAAIKLSEDFNRIVVEHLGEGMGIIQDGVTVYVNRKATEIIRRPLDQMLGVNFLSWVHADDHAIVADRQRRRQAGETVPDRYELRCQHLDGTSRWLETHASVIPWKGRQATMTFFSDITERKQMEQELQNTSSEREAILNSALVGIVLSRHRSHGWVNDKFAEMVGYSRAELIGQPSSLVHVSEAQWQQLGPQTRSALSTQGTYTAERQLKRKNGELFWVQLAGRCVRPLDPDSGVIWTFLDITERKQAEQDIRDALERQKQLNELRSRFVAMTSHEFRTPLATILSSAELLKYYSDRLPADEKAEVLQSIEDGVERMTRMLDRVLLLGKAEAHMLEFKPRQTDLAALCHSLAEEARHLLTGSGCTLEAGFIDEALAGAGDGVEGAGGAGGANDGLYDEKLLRHIFANLLSNAIKYSPHGGAVRFLVRRDAAGAVFTVSDQGIGIPADEIEHLFESFHRASNVGTIAGTGLGLAIVKQAVDLHGGNIAVHSEAGRGTTFTVTL